MNSPFRNFDNMCWPVPCDRTEELEYSLRHAKRGTIFSMEDRLIAASIIAAYRDLVWKGSTRRNSIICELRKVVPE